MAITNRQIIVRNITKNVQKVKASWKIWYRFLQDHYTLEDYLIQQKNIIEIFKKILRYSKNILKYSKNILEYSINILKYSKIFKKNSKIF